MKREAPVKSAAHNSQHRDRSIYNTDAPIDLRHVRPKAAVIRPVEVPSLPGSSTFVDACQAGPIKTLTSVSGRIGRMSFLKESAPLRSRLLRGPIKRDGLWAGWTTGRDVTESSDSTFKRMSGSTGYQVQSVQACVVFDTASGEIHHVHQVVTMEGAEATSGDEVKQRALSFARQRLGSGTPLPGEQTVRTVEGELEALQVDPSLVDRTQPQRVDPKTKKLVPIEQSPS